MSLVVWLIEQRQYPNSSLWFTATDRSSDNIQRINGWISEAAVASTAHILSFRFVRQNPCFSSAADNENAIQHHSPGSFRRSRRRAMGGWGWNSLGPHIPKRRIAKRIPQERPHCRHRQCLLSRQNPLSTKRFKAMRLSQMQRAVPTAGNRWASANMHISGWSTSTARLWRRKGHGQTMPKGPKDLWSFIPPKI